MLKPGDILPHVELTTVHGNRVRYRDLWQRRQVALVAVRDGTSAAARTYADSLAEHVATGDDSVVLVFEPASQAGAGRDLIPAPSAAIVDRWGEVKHVTQAGIETAPPSADDLNGWLDFVRRHCPECEGEVR